jgi:hypothetical protein
MQELVKSVSITNMLNQRNAALDLIIQAQTLLKQAQTLTTAAHMGTLDLKFSPIYGRNEVKFLESTTIHSITNSIDAHGWAYLMNESGLRSLMDAEARHKWDDTIREQKHPQFTLSNIEATFASLYQTRGDMFERGVLSIFRKLSWDYKTNKPFAFGKKIIINYMFDSSGHINHCSADGLDDLMRVFHVIDNKPELDHRNSMYYQISNANNAKLKEFDNDYIHVKWYKKGTGHITFKRTDIIDQMNHILAKHHPNSIAERQ